MTTKCPKKKSDNEVYSHLRDLLLLLILSVALYVVTAVTLTKAAALDLAYVTNYLGCAAFLLGSIAYIFVPFVQAYNKASSCKSPKQGEKGSQP
ncbi:putative integral membrane protein [Babesia bovis T2Bo]|uniref:putative integral membrane protein n=1 Tax=Babesia bovis T2Bo TaxID=484906 RepID=UPI001C3518CB|nr:putative integral membrane protein [Babesia bovis T2Bo]KAG6440083.1 putative integral membrane protein [Babesia bovis T2Bo]